MADPLGGDQFDVENLAEAEIEKLLKQVCNKCHRWKMLKIQFRIFMASDYMLSVSHHRSGTIKFYRSEGEDVEEVQ